MADVLRLSSDSNLYRVAARLQIPLKRDIKAPGGIPSGDSAASRCAMKTVHLGNRRAPGGNRWAGHGSRNWWWWRGIRGDHPPLERGIKDAAISAAGINGACRGFRVIKRDGEGRIWCGLDMEKSRPEELDAFPRIWGSANYGFKTRSEFSWQEIRGRQRRGGGERGGIGTCQQGRDGCAIHTC
jgi:hypothetical protein